MSVFHQMSGQMSGLGRLRLGYSSVRTGRTLAGHLPHVRPCKASLRPDGHGHTLIGVSECPADDAGGTVSLLVDKERVLPPAPPMRGRGAPAFQTPQIFSEGFRHG